MTMRRIYNYPWSGRFGRIAKQCLYCGSSGLSFQVSSFSTCCNSSDCRQKLRQGAAPIPELLAEMEADSDRLVRKWCRDRGMNYDTVVAEMFEQYGGPPNQDVP